MAGLLATIVDLGRLGNLGVGLAIFVLGFYLVREKELNAEASSLRRFYLKIGFAFAVVTALMTLVPLFVSRAGPMSERLAFSPDFDSEKLPPPTIRLPDGTQAAHNAKFDLQPSAGTQVVTVSMDATLDQVRNLKQASANSISALGRVTKQRDALAAKAVTVKTTADAEPKTPALQILQLNSANSDALREAYAKSLNSGDYRRANALTVRLNTSAIAAEPAVAKIAYPQRTEGPH